MFGDGHIPPERDRSVEDDDSGFLDVLLLLLRSWPYIKPQVLGHWWLPGQGFEDRVADSVSGGGYHFRYAPILAAAIAVMGPMTGLVPASMAWPMNLLYFPLIFMVICMALMAFTEGPQQSWATGGLVLFGMGANVVATYVIDGSADGFYVGAVTVACIIGWKVQYRRNAGKLEFRFRTGTHLVYFYAINFAQRFIALSLGLVLADLLNQNLLQNQPVAPGLANLLGIPEWAQGSVSELTVEQRYDLLWIYVVISLSAYLIQLPLQVINPYYNMWIMQRINQDLRVALLERWHQLSLNYHSGHRTGDSIYRIYQDSAMVTAVIGQLIGLTLAMMSYYTCVVLVTLLSPWIGLFAGTLVIPALIWAQWAMPRVRTRTLVYRAATSDVTSTIQETFGSIRLIKAFNATDRAQKRLDEDSVVAFNAAYRVRALIALVSIVMFTIAATFLISGEFLMAMWANNGDPTFATDLIALVGVSWIVWNLGSFNWTKDQFREATGDIRLLLRNWMTAQDMAMGLRRVFDILDIEPDVKDDDNAVPLTEFNDEIRFNDVYFAYEEERPVLDGVSFVARPGTVTAIIGPTGSGKSTLMALLLRLFDTHRGSISIDGRDLREFKVDSLRSNIAIALQENVLFAMSVRDNIRYVAPDATEAQLQEAIRVSAMQEFISGLPNGLDTLLSDRGGKLSTGQRQRLSIARAVVRDTPILILDEPTAALDAATEHDVMTNLAQWGRGDSVSGTGQHRAIFLITHRISTIRRADNIVYLDEGRIMEHGNHDALMAIEDGRYRAFVEAESNLSNTSKGLTDV
jgi:ATP-binding cassette, subfamily B, bacterial